MLFTYLMESAAAPPRFIPKDPMVFLCGGSCSAACEEEEVFEIPPPAMDHSAKPILCKQKEVMDVGMEDDSDSASLVDNEVGESDRGKKVLSNSSIGFSGLADEESGDDISPLSEGSAELEDPDVDANLYFDEDECDTDYDDMIFDDNDDLEAHFDHMEFPPGVEVPVPWLVGSPKNDTKPAASTSTHSGYSLRGGLKKVVDEMELKFEGFAKFDTVEDFSDHHYGKIYSASKMAQKKWSKRIQEEWQSLEKNLPAEIFVRAYETRMDLMRAVIIGAQGTPYHDGLFFFDIYFPSSYPHIPPEVYYHSGGLRINPNLYHSGKVCLSLLNTWSGTGQEKWIPGESTILQVLVSIQGLILNEQPYFNEPGYERMKGTKAGEDSSSMYNEETFMHSLKTMVYSMQRPPKHFEDFVIGYFRKNARYILVSCVACLNGAPPGGGLVSDKSCSEQLRSNVGAFIPRLVQTFTDIGAEGCQVFLTKSSTDSSCP